MMNSFDCFMVGTWPDDDQTETSEREPDHQQRYISEEHEGVYFYYIKLSLKCIGITFDPTHE